MRFKPKIWRAAIVLLAVLIAGKLEAGDIVQLDKLSISIIYDNTTPEKGFFRSLYLLYFQRILPLIGSFFSKHHNAYTYLPESVLKFPTPVEFSKIMRQAGFENIRFKQMTFGIVTLFIGTKP